MNEAQENGGCWGVLAVSAVLLLILLGLVAIFAGLVVVVGRGLRGPLTGRRGVVTEINIYPIKSCGGISVGRGVRWPLDGRGLLHDRRWMVVDGSGRFVTQREVPRLCQVRPTLLRKPDDGSALSCGEIEGSAVPSLAVLSHAEEELGGLLLEFPGAPPFVCPIVRGVGRTVEVWGSEMPASDQGVAVSTWLTNRVLRAKGGEKGSEVKDESLGELFLVWLDEGLDVDRSIKAKYLQGANAPGQVAFADGMPVLVTTERSLTELNSWILQDKGESPVPMDRFRPNIVVGPAISETERPIPFEEDVWTHASVGTVRLRASKLCTRCAVPTTDQRTGVQRGKQHHPFKALDQHRKAAPGAVCFGTMYFPVEPDTSTDPTHACGSLAVGEPWIVQKTGTIPPFPRSKSSFFSI